MNNSNMTNKTNKPTYSEMTASDVTGLYNSLENLGVHIWIEGGWSVDAALGQQTRSHADIDIIIRQKDLPHLRYLLESQGYKNIPRDDTTPWNFVLGDDLGHVVDVHVIVFDANGNGIYGPIENNTMYPADALSWSGVINDQAVRCLSPEYMVKSHTGYKLREQDFKDVFALCERFNIELPPEYGNHKK